MVSKIARPTLPKYLPPLTASAVLDPATTLEVVEIQHPSWPAQTAKRLRLEGVRLIEPDLTAAVLREGGWSDVQILGGQLGGLDLTGTSVRRAEISRARLSGAVFIESELRDITIEDCKLDLANFRHAKLLNVHFIRCQLIDADFGGATLHNVEFTACELVSADFSGATLRSVDLRSSTLHSLKGIAGLKGGTLSYDQMVTLLPELAATLEIIVKND